MEKIFWLPHELTGKDMRSIDHCADIKEFVDFAYEKHYQRSTTSTGGKEVGGVVLTVNKNIYDSLHTMNLYI